jgi:hypothetical protein
MTTSPTASVVSRALRRDVKIITVDTSQREGYSVHRGSSFSGPSVWVSVSDAEATNVRHARKLIEELTEVYGWKITSNGENSSIFYVTSVPSKSDAAKAKTAWETAEATRRARTVSARLIELAASNNERIDYDAIDKILAEATETADGGLVL